jgi:NAD(P)-dependent dehydrogenase (short-subunit alcohol dehydrogenase family)
MGRVEGKVAIVTGGALGLGKAAAERLAQEGAIVAVTDVRDDDGQTAVDAIIQAGGTAQYWHMDVSQETEVRRTINEVADQFDGLDVLVNNAGISGANKPTHEVSEDEWDAVMDINVKGVFFCTKHAVPHLKQRARASIINLSSIYGLVGGADVPPYHASKGAVRLMTKTDALLYAGDQIRVNSIHPGFIWTPMVDAYLGEQEDPEAARKAADAAHPLGHIGEPDDVAYAVVYLASDESKFVTGSELVIDGGYTAR